MTKFKRIMFAWTSFWVAAVALIVFQFVGCCDRDAPPDQDPVDDIVVEVEQVVTTSNHFPRDPAATFVTVTGFYEVWATIDLSGDDQKNESCFVQGYNDTDQEINPKDANAGPYLVVQDDGRTGALEIYAGTFDFHKGANWLTIIHYEEIAEEWPDFIVSPGFRGPESVHCSQFRLEFVK